MVPLATLLPMIATVGQGTAHGLGDLASAHALFTDSDKERLAELKRRELLGQLGYTQEELGAARNEMLAPLQAQARELRQTGTRGNLGGDALKALDKQAATLQHSLGTQTSRIASMNAQEAARQRQEERALEHAKDQRRVASNAALLETLTGGLAGAAQAQQILQSQRADKELYEALMESPLGDQAKAAGITDPKVAKLYFDMMQEYGAWAPTGKPVGQGSPNTIIPSNPASME